MDYAISTLFQALFAAGALLAELLMLLLGLMILAWIFEHWATIALVLGGIVALFATLFILGTLAAAWQARKQLRAGPPVDPRKEAAEAIRCTIATTPKLGRYAWAATDSQLISQWQQFRETGRTPMRRKTLARKARQADQPPKPKPPPLGPGAQKILAEINASPKLAQHAWHTDEAGLLEQWQRYQTHGQLPIKHSKLERRMTKASARQPGVCR
ncbi:hypothetical protein D3C78_1177510 [compost metagenome]